MPKLRRSGVSPTQTSPLGSTCRDQSLFLAGGCRWRILALAVLIVGSAGAARGAPGSRVMQKPVPAGDAISRLVPALHDRRPAARVAAVKAIGKVGGSRAVAALLPCLDDRDWPVAVAAANALGRLHDPEALPSLISTFKRSEDARVVFSVSDAIGRIGTPAAVSALLRLMDTDRSFCAAQALADHPRAASWSPLVRLLKTGTPRCRPNAAWALQGYGRKSLPLLIATLSDPAADVRSAATQALDQIGSPQAAPALISHLGDPEGAVREGAIHALSSFPHARLPVPQIVKALGDRDWEVRTAAARAFARHPDARAVPALMACLWAKDEAYRDQFARVNGKPMPADAIVWSEQIVWEAVVEALKVITKQDLGSDPAAWRAWWCREWYREIALAAGQAVGLGKHGESYSELGKAAYELENVPSWGRPPHYPGLVVTGTTLTGYPILQWMDWHGYAKWEMDNALYHWRKGNCKQAMGALGRGIHAKMDYWAHSSRPRLARVGGFMVGCGDALDNPEYAKHQFPERYHGAIHDAKAYLRDFMAAQRRLGTGGRMCRDELGLPQG